MMLVKITDTGAGRAAMLCDEHGVPLPSQAETVLACSNLNDFGTITVTFIIDGTRIKLA